MSDVLDVDDESTWPDGLRDALVGFASGLDPATATTDIGISVDDSQIVSDFGLTLLRAYHATRLLPHEDLSVRDSGLRDLSAGFVAERIAAAEEAGAISDSQARRLRKRTVFNAPTTDADDPHRTRAGLVHGVLGLNAFSAYASGFDRFFSIWGGEGIYWPDSDAPRLLRSPGSPAIVVLDLDLADDVPTDVFPSLAKVLVAHLAHLDDRSGSFMRRGPIDAARIVDIWHPGIAEYDRFDGLPVV